MKCPRCYNEKATYLYELNGKYYCRKCISFSRIFIENKRMTKQMLYSQSQTHYRLKFQLSLSQKRISNELLKCYKNKENAYVWAVCGSGKTEIVFQTIQYALNKGHRVCFCIPRKELVKELYVRIQESFKDIEIGLIYGGVCKNEDAQFIICTMHQLYKFENSFGFHLMVADEVDAFPFKNNEVLEEIFARCCLGTYIKLSATFQEADIQNGQLLIMNKRYHQYDLPVPHSILFPQYLQKWAILFILLMKRKRWIIYVPTLEDVENFVRFLVHRKIPAQGVSSLTINTQQSLQNLKEHDFYVLVSTTILERGVTIEDVHVIVYHGNHTIFDERTLIQIAGRVGRKPNHPTGDIIILYSNKSKEIRKCINTIKRLNRMSV